jgi:hypothetical protein
MPLLDAIIESWMAWLKVKAAGRVLVVFGTWDGDVDFMVVVFVVRIFFGLCDVM